MAWDNVGPALSCQDCPILFVFGAARSGTTILNNLLYRHFSYGMGPEGTFLAEWAKRLTQYGDLAQEANLQRLVNEIADCRMLYIARHKYKRNPFDVSPALILERLRERSYAGVVYAVFECMAELQNCRRVGNKNPDYGRQFSLLHTLFPTQAKYLCIVRDGRDVALSILKTRWGLSSTYIAAKVWAECLEDLASMEAQLPADRLHVITYENLLQHPRETLEGVRRFLGVSESEAAIEAAAVELTEGRRAMNFNKWKTKMSAGDLRIFEGLAGPWLQKHGYTLSGNPAEVRWSEHLLYQAREYARLARVNLRHAVVRKP